MAREAQCVASVQSSDAGALTGPEQLLRRADYFGKLIDGWPELLLQVADAEVDQQIS